MLGTTRLRLRLWRDEDLAAFAALNSDPRVMEYMPKVLGRAESDASAERINEHFVRYGFGLWAVEVIGIADFIGFTGLSVPRFEAHFTPCVEIAWRLAHDHWGFGYATEAARAARDYGFRHLELEQIVSFTVPANQRSRKVMEHIGMTHSPDAPDDDFRHPPPPRRPSAPSPCPLPPRSICIVCRLKKERRLSGYVLIEVDTRSVNAAGSEPNSLWHNISQPVQR
jgi:RimJ/RimL family protein N-acetyltransferase